MSKLIVVTPGTKLSVRRGRLVISRRGGGKYEVPINEVEEVLISTRGALITTNVITELVALGVPIYFIRGDGTPYAIAWPALPNKTVATRRAQYEVVVRGDGLDYGARFVAAKIHNKAWLLKYLGRSRRLEEVRECGYRVEEYVWRVLKCGSRDCVMREEAEASRKYWRCYSELLPRDAGFTCRDQDGSDPVNTSLNYGYGILRLACFKALLMAGLDPYAGFLHVDKSGRPSLTLDFMEPFRFAIDKAVAELLTRYLPEVHEGLLTHEARSSVASKVIDALTTDRYVYGSYRKSLESIIHLQAKELANSLRTGTPFKPFRVRW